MMISTGKNRVLFSMIRTTARESLFAWAGPIATTRIVLFARKQDKIILSDLDSLEPYRIGVIRDDAGEQLLLSSGVDKTQIRQVSNVTSLVRMLDRGRIHLLAYEEKATRTKIKEAGLDMEQFEVVYTLTEGELYFAFSLGTPQSLIDKLQLGIDKVKHIKLDSCKTQYEVIMDKY